MTTSGRTYRLLIIDDNELDRHLYTRMLARQGPDGFQIRYASDGADGLAALKAKTPDCVLLDFNLPDMNGLQLLSELLPADDPLPCAIILITAQGNEGIAVEAMKRGVQDYLVKGKIDDGRLCRAILSAVSQMELRQRLAGSLRDLTDANAALEQQIATREATEAALRKAKDAAEQANQAKTRFVAMVTHELRTPLNGILGYAELLRIEGGLSSQQTNRVMAMMQAGRHLLEMIDQVLDFTCIESGRLELHPVPVLVRDLIDGCIRVIGPMATEHALSLHTSGSHDAPTRIMTDPARLRQVVLNLLGNAVKFTRNGGVELRVVAGAEPGGLRIEVVDTGPGVSDADRLRLFQDFERLDLPNSAEGAGLGLAISARIIGLMGGTIGHRHNPAGGSIFWIELPPAQPAAHAALERPLSSTTRSSGRRVLLVDDIAMNRDVIGSFLAAAGHDVLLASGGREAVRMASEHALDVILMDVRMPDIDGLEATRQIRRLPDERARVPIIALTAYTFGHQVAQCRDAGMDGHVAKPVDYTTLVHTIESAAFRSSSSWPAPTEAATTEEAGVAGVHPSSPLVLDRRVLDEVLSFMAHDDAIASLRSVRLNFEQLSDLLAQPAKPSQLAEVAHQVASTSGMFGFMPLAESCRTFEAALMDHRPEADSLARQLVPKLTASRRALDDLWQDVENRPRRLQSA
jgi:signal transduction histidine kinase/HPt (histidine-containing phosphotransfer) domain-containing protein